MSNKNKNKNQSDYMEVSSLGLFGGYVEKVARYIINLSEEAAYQRISSKYNINGYKRIYFIHIRKTAGTSLNQMLLSLGGEDGGEVYHKLGATLKRRLNSNGLVFTSNKYVLNKGNYFYGYSHTPIYDLKIPRDTYFITCFRDPVKRVISLYNMLKQIKRVNPKHPLALSEGKWLGESIEDFLENAPRSVVLNQLYMFSRDLDVDEAISRVSNVNLVIYTEDFNNGIIKLNSELGIELESICVRKTTYETEQSYNIESIKKTLKLEYDFLEKVKFLM